MPATNVADDRRRRYVVSPAEHVAQIRRCRAGGRTVVGAYHSHPSSPPLPSISDRTDAFADFWFLIAGPVNGSGPLAVRGYRLVDGRLLEEPLVVVPSSP